MLSVSPTQHLSLSASIDSHDTQTQEPMNSGQTLQGETQGAKITISRSAVAGLPLPGKSSSPAQRSSPAGLFAEQYQASDENQDLSLLDDVPVAPAAPALATPNRPYRDDAASPTPSNNPRRQKVMPFDRAQAKPLVAQTKAVVQNDPLPKNDNRQSIENRQYSVQDGDNLYNIAKRELGDVTRWREIYRLNSDTIGTNVGYLTPGTVIFMPE